MGFIMHFYIIFGTNLLNEGPVQIVVFRLFECFAEKEYQTVARFVFGTNAIQETWSARQGSNKAATR